MKKHIRKYVNDPRLIQLLEFPVLFLGALPGNIPALYSLMNYADIKLGTWYPMGGMYKIVEGMYQVALELGVEFRFNHEVTRIVLENGTAKGWKRSIPETDKRSLKRMWLSAAPIIISLKKNCSPRIKELHGGILG